MKTFAASLAAIAAVALIVPAVAQEGKGFGEWHCADNTDQFFDLTVQEGLVRVNNFTISEGKSFTSGDQLEIMFSASVSNRTQGNFNMSAEVVGLVPPATSTDDKVMFFPGFALSAKPSFGMVSSGKSEDINASIFTQPGLLASTVGLCVRITGAGR